jgi:hypothetical protein
MTDGFSNLFQAVPPQLRDLGSRLADRILPPNGSGALPSSGGDNGAGSSANNVDLSAVQPLIATGSAILARHLSAEERETMTLSTGITQALNLADPAEQATLLKIQGLLTLLPALGEQTVGE